LTNNRKKYDAIIIGSGQAGNPLAFEYASRELNVALIEKNYLGGSCINFGCTPSKALLASANLNHRVKHSRELGVKVENVELDFEKVMKRKEEIVQAFRENIEEAIDDTDKIDLYKGIGSFIDRNTIKIKLNNGKEEIIEGDKIFINSGSKPNIIPIDGIDDISYLDSTSIMELNELPEHLIIIGSGYIGIEFAQMFARFGSKVTVIGRSEDILKREDKDVSSRIQDILEKDNINFLLETDTKRVEETNNGIEVCFERNEEKDSIEGSHILLAVGRSPVTEELSLEKVDIDINDRGYIIVDDTLKTNLDNIYALGDIIGGPKFTHIAYDDFRIVKDDLFGEGKRSKDGRLVPYTLFTDPQLGRVGLSEKEAREQGYDIEVSKIEMDKQGRPIEEGKTQGFMKAIINKENHQILGAAILGYQGGELMAMIQIAMMGRVPYESLRDGIFTHPSLSETLNNLFSI